MPHHLAEVDLREVERGGVEPAPARGPPHRRVRRRGSPESRERASSRAPRGLQVETDRPRGQCMGVHSVAVTGAAGLVGRHLLPVLAAHPDVERVLGLDVREPERRPPQPSSSPASTSPAPSCKPLLEGIDVVVHLAGVVDPVARRRRSWRGSTSRARARCSTAAAAVGARPHRAHLERDGLRRVAEQPGAAHEDAAAAARTRTSRPRCRAPRSSGCSPSGGPSTPT